MALNWRCARGWHQKHEHSFGFGTWFCGDPCGIRTRDSPPWERHFGPAV